MGDEEGIQYDYGSSVSFISALLTVCGLLLGFTFTGTVVVLTRLEDPTAILSQIVLAIMNVAMIIFFVSLWELNLMNFLISSQSQKPIIPLYPARWHFFGKLFYPGCYIFGLSISTMFLLKGLVLLFVLSLCGSTIVMIWMYHNRWKPVEEKIHRYYSRFGVV